MKGWILLAIILVILVVGYVAFATAIVSLIEDIIRGLFAATPGIFGGN